MLTLGYIGSNLQLTVKRNYYRLALVLRKIYRFAEELCRPRSLSLKAVSYTLIFILVNKNREKVHWKKEFAPTINSQSGEERSQEFLPTRGLSPEDTGTWTKDRRSWEQPSLRSCVTAWLSTLFYIALLNLTKQKINSRICINGNWSLCCVPSACFWRDE